MKWNKKKTALEFKVAALVFIFGCSIYFLGCSAAQKEEKREEETLEKSLEYHPSGYDGAPGQTAFRIRPLDEELRAWNEKYVMPIGYERNNLLITDWDAKDYSQVDFYDLYETCYPHIRGERFPYVPEEGAKYLIPKKEFEEVLRQYFSLEPEQIQQQTQYDSLTECYHYRPRGLYDCQMPYGPYPEVTACEEMGNGTYKLTVEAVWVRGKRIRHAEVN